VTDEAELRAAESGSYFSMIDEFACFVDVRDRNPALDEHLREELRAMARFRPAFAAEERYGMAVCIGALQTIDTGDERFVGATSVVIDVTVLVVAVGIVRTTTERVTQEDVSNLLVPKTLFERLSRKLGPFP
jgi:hypothetical protein